jgi:nucleotide-binding universal stress UspA family protein
MSWNTILVSLNDFERNKQTVKIACQLAAHQDAHIIGLFVTPMMPVYPVPGAYGLSGLIDTHEAYFKEKAEQAKAHFEDVAGKNGLRNEWRHVKSRSSIIAPAVIEHGREADIVVVSQVNPDDPDGAESDFCDHVVMETGRPTLIVPYSGKIEPIGGTVVIGWNGTREAARAAFDALPLLQTASQVLLVWVDPEDDGETAGQLPGSEMAATLSRHGINVIAEALPTGHLAAADALLNRVADSNANLLVAGAYGHSRMREFVFGGVTNSLLKHMTVPVLMSN